MKVPFRAPAAGLCLSAAAFVLTLTGAPAGHAQQPASPRASAPAVVPAPPTASAAKLPAQRLARPDPQITGFNAPRFTYFKAGNENALTARLDLKPDATVREAASQLADQTKREIVVDADVPGDARVTIRTGRIRFDTALDLISQAADANWGREIKDGKTVYRIGKNVPEFAQPTILFRSNGNEVEGPNLIFGQRPRVPSVSTPSSALGTGVIYSLSQREQRSTFSCPHCKRQATVIRKAETPKCPKCERIFQPSWQFCPYDGTRRPASETTWRVCPFCGKQVSDAATAADPLLGETPFPLMTRRTRLGLG